MAFSTPFSELSRVVERLERGGVDLHRVTADGGEPVDGVLSATVEFGLSLCAAAEAEWVSVEIREGTVDADGRLSVDLSIDASLVPSDLAASPTGATVTASDDGLVVTMPVEIPVDPSTREAETPVPTDGVDRGRDAPDSEADRPGPGPKPVDESIAETTDGPADDRESSARDVPPFRDHDLLREVYESCDTFAEMTEAIGMDVTAETVRRYMIDAGIHEPASYDTGSDDTDAATDEADDGPTAGDGRAAVGDDAAVDAHEVPPDEAILADGIGLPDGVTVEGLIDAITVSNTLYEVSHTLDLERGRARDVLADLNLLDLVVGRLAMEAEREVTRDEVIGRLRAGADGS